MDIIHNSKRFLPDKSSINVVERRSVPGGYFSELYIQVKGMLEDRDSWFNRFSKSYIYNLKSYIYFFRILVL